MRTRFSVLVVFAMVLTVVPLVPSVATLGAMNVAVDATLIEDRSQGFAVGVADLGGGDAFVQAVPVPLTAGGNVARFLLSPDATRVVYLADSGTANVYELFSVGVSGGLPMRLSPTLPAGANVGSRFVISPDSKRVVFRVDLLSGDDPLYTVPIGGGTARQLDVAASDVVVTPDSSRVVYRSVGPSSTLLLRSVPIGGGTPIEYGTNTLDHLVTPDSKQVVFQSDQNTAGVYELFAAPLSGGAATNLSGPMVEGGDVSYGPNRGFTVTSDGSRAVYRADRRVDEVYELFSVPITGGTSTVLNGSLVAGGDVDDFTLSPDGTRVIYRANQDIFDFHELFSVPTVGGTVTRLNGSLVDGGDVFSFYEVTPDSMRVLYPADRDADRWIDLYSVPIDGGSSEKLSRTPWDFTTFDHSGVISFLISPDSATVVYRAGDAMGNPPRLYTAPVAGGPYGVLSKVYSPSIWWFQISADSKLVVYAADEITDDVIELFSVPIAGGALVKLSGEMVAGGDLAYYGVDAPYVMTPDETQVVYAADAIVDGRLDLFVADLLSAPAATYDGPYTVEPGGTLVVGAAVGVLANDSDREGDILTATLKSPPQYGTVDIQSDGSFTYVHDGSSTTVDDFSYVANDGTVDSDPAGVLINIGTGPPPPPTEGTFIDDDDSVFVVDIEWLAAEGITKGCNPPVNDRFCPDDFVTRGQMAAFLTRALALTDRLDSPFTDDDTSIFEADIERLAAAGITKGCNPPTNDRYCPDDFVTRGQMAAFLVRALGYTDNGAGDLFIDDDGSVFEADIDRLGTAGVTRGCNPPTNDRFCPDGLVTRGQMAAFLHRALGG